MKAERQRRIIEIITNYEIETQEELAQMLAESGFFATQATISRDIRELKLTKVPRKYGRHKYALPDGASMEMGDKYMRILHDGIISMEEAGNILVIKTVSGMAMAVGAALDAIPMKEVAGCIAGDDTVMCVVKNIVDCAKVKEYLESGEYA